MKWKFYWFLTNFLMKADLILHKLHIYTHLFYYSTKTHQIYTYYRFSPWYKRGFSYRQFHKHYPTIKKIMEQISEALDKVV